MLVWCRAQCHRCECRADREVHGLRCGAAQWAAGASTVSDTFPEQPTPTHFLYSGGCKKKNKILCLSSHNQNTPIYLYFFVPYNIGQYCWPYNCIPLKKVPSFVVWIFLCMIVQSSIIDRYIGHEYIEHCIRFLQPISKRKRKRTANQKQSWSRI